MFYLGTRYVKGEVGDSMIHIRSGWVKVCIMYIYSATTTTYLNEEIVHNCLLLGSNGSYRQ